MTLTIGAYLVMRKPKNVRNNNPLNVKESADWIGERPLNLDKTFEEFKTPKHGFRAAYIILLQYLERGDNTIQKIIAKWAPANTDENNHTSNYIEFVASKMQLSPASTVFPDMLPRLMLHMSKFEGDSINYFTLEQAYQGVELAQNESFVIARLDRMGYSLGVTV